MENNKQNKRNVQINATSPKEDVLAALTGKWSSTVINGWSVIHISDRYEYWRIICQNAGSYMLPRCVDEITVAKVFNYEDGTVSCIPIKLQQKAIKVTKPCMVEVVITNL